MKRLLRLGILVSALSAGCISFPRQAFDKAGNPGIRSIALLEVPPPERFEVVNLNGISSGFGLAGAAIESAEEERKTTHFSARVSSDRKELGRTTMRRLMSGLEKDGYRVTVLDNARPVKEDVDDQDADYSSIRTDADAILDVYFTRAGYLAPGSDYLPWLMMGARLIDSKTKKRLFAQQYSYGNAFETQDDVVHLQSNTKYSYGDEDVLMDHAEEAAAALRLGAELIAVQITVALR